MIFSLATDLDLLLLLLQLVLVRLHHVLQLFDEVLLHLKLFLHVLHFWGGLDCFGSSLGTLTASPPHGADLGSLGHYKLETQRLAGKEDLMKEGTEHLHSPIWLSKQENLKRHY